VQQRLVRLECGQIEHPPVPTTLAHLPLEASGARQWSRTT
jgi:hypothetical protein